ncbi:universal stress protein [Longibacter salinarum]|uniref:Universal stress protein n=1 Tax=Longibacter salinarum TaxID=1850348 RepID=A0A2A8CYN0_9BACT|nr:amino acid permease [Longibacter salinarum]PEN13721.1 universal stress protein [Longibacter salinarum]
MATDDLRRELGFWDALTIGAGTMIGAGIFLLAGVALELTGPAAIFSYLAAGLVCMITAASAAELATGMPTSGGDYYFVSRSLGPALGAISGVGIWLSLTFAISFYLFGLGEYLSQLLPVTPFWGALVGGILLTGLNVYGAKESGKMQVFVVLTLLAILGGFCILGFFQIETDNFTPFFPFGTAPVASTTALVFVSFLGFVKIAAVAEEIKDPAKNLPRTLIGSVALVTLLYVVILLVIGGMFTQETIGDVRDPLTTAARTLAGPVGAGFIIFAGLLATVSSANASIMASSRINLAMARDRMVPNALSTIHQRFLTPHRAILLTGLLACAFLLFESIEDLAKIASVLQLYSYAALNIGCVVLRVAKPKWYEPSYRTPLFPFAQIFAALACVGIIVSSGLFAQIAIVVLIIASLAWYAVWGRGRVEIENAMPEFQERWGAEGFSALMGPATKFSVELPEVLKPGERAIDPNEPRRVSVALANPATESDLLRIGRYIATGKDRGGHVSGLHLVRVPLQTPLEVARDQFAERPSLERAISGLVSSGDGGTTELRPLDETEFESVIDVAHDVFGGLITETQDQRSDLLLMGWQGGFNVRRIYNSPIQRIMSDLAADLAVLKDRGVTSIKRILLPWGGGLHAQLGLEVAVRIAGATGATVQLLRVVKKDVDTAGESAALSATVKQLVGEQENIEYLVRDANSVTEGVEAAMEENAPDLVIIGASREWTIRQVLFGSIPDVVADAADCSVLMVRRYVPDTLSIRAAEGFKRIKESAGLTTSPEE